jgi:transcriptional regulator with XRE-family HTH domain
MLTRNPAATNGRLNQTARDRDINYKIGQNIKAIRKAARVSQESLAEHLGITFQQVQKYENGKNRISASTLLVIAAFFGVSVNEFIGEFDKGTRPGELSKLSAELARLRKIVVGIQALASGKDPG